jgi:hypothetical protein
MGNEEEEREKVRLLIFLSVLGLGFTAIAQRGTRKAFPIQQMMNAAQFQAAGLQKLTPKELAALDEWTGTYAEVLSRSGDSMDSWRRNEVTPVVLVKPGLAGFIVDDGASTDSWSKSQVTPVCLVKFEFGMFAPDTKEVTFQTWFKREVKPMVVVTPHNGGFAAFET